MNSTSACVSEVVSYKRGTREGSTAYLGLDQVH